MKTYDVWMICDRRGKFRYGFPTDTRKSCWELFHNEYLDHGGGFVLAEFIKVKKLEGYRAAKVRYVEVK